jgi:hypothetical protein
VSNGALSIELRDVKPLLTVETAELDVPVLPVGSDIPPVAPGLRLVFLRALVGRVVVLAESGALPILVRIVRMGFGRASSDRLVLLTGSEVAPLLAPSAVDESACAKPVPLANAAPNPSVTAPTPNQV